MATYRWRIPQLKALQFDGENHKDIKKLIGDDTDDKEPSVGTGKFEQVDVKVDKKLESRASPPSGHSAPTLPAQKPGGPKDTAPKVDEAKEKGDVGPKPAAQAPKEIREKLKLKEGDWVTVDTVNGKVEINPEGFPDKYEYIAG